MADPAVLLHNDLIVPARPVKEPIWRGTFSFQNENFMKIYGLKAHISLKACSKVWEAAKKMPSELCLQVLPRLSFWPPSFHRSPPTEDSIAVYIFPEDERARKDFQSLLTNMTGSDLILKTIVNNAELFIFTSLQLPEGHHRFQGENFLWGVFKGRKAPPQPEVGDHLLQQTNIRNQNVSLNAADCADVGASRIPPGGLCPSHLSASPQHMNQASGIQGTTQIPKSEELRPHETIKCSNSTCSSHSNTSSNFSSILKAANDSNDFDEVNGLLENGFCTGAATFPSLHLKDSSLEPILQFIIKRYGDIFQHCLFKSNVMRAPIVESVCRIIWKLKDENAIILNDDHLKDLESAVVGAECVNVDVSWLRRRLEDLKQLKSYRSLMKELTEHREVATARRKSLEQKKVKLEELKSEHQLLEEQLGSLLAEIESLKSKQLKVVASKCEFIKRESLAEGLI